MARGIVLHDYFQNADGGGRAALAIAKELNFDICYGFRTADHPYFIDFPADLQQYNLNVSVKTYGLKQLVLSHAFANETSFLKEYDYIIYSGFYCPLAIKNAIGKRNIIYCHTPPRFIYDQYDFYLSRLPLWKRPLFHAAANYLKPKYEQAFGKMDVVLTNSEHVKARIQKYLGRDAMVAYTPCDTKGYQWQGQGNYYLSTARLDPLKRVDRVVEAFVQMPDKQLIVASGGSEFEKLKALASKSANITFTGWISEQRLRELVNNCIATIYIPKEEDFGLSPVESMAAGKPVIGVAEGGIRETVVDRETGILLPANPEVEHIIAVVTELNTERAYAMRRACEERARIFNKDCFFDKLKKTLDL